MLLVLKGSGQARRDGCSKAQKIKQMQENLFSSQEPEPQEEELVWTREKLIDFLSQFGKCIKGKSGKILPLEKFVQMVDQAIESERRK